MKMNTRTTSMKINTRTIVAAALLVSASYVNAQSTWNGGGGDNLWSTGANWGGTAPASGADVAFAGNTRLTPDLSTAFTIHSLAFSSGAGPFNLSSTNSSALTIDINSAGGANTNVINSSTTAQTISQTVIINNTLAGSTRLNASAGDLTFSDITLTKNIQVTGGAGRVVTLSRASGAGTISLTNAVSNGFTLRIGGNGAASGTLAMATGTTYIDSSTGVSGSLTSTGATTLGATSGSDSSTLYLGSGVNFGRAFTINTGNSGTTTIGADSTMSGSATFGGAITANKDFTINVGNASGLVTVNGITATARNITKTGSGTVLLNSASTLDGGAASSSLAINGGTVRVATLSNIFANASGGGALSFNGGALEYTAASATQLTTTRFASVTSNAGGATFNISDPAGSVNVQRLITGAGGVSKIGAGSLTLSATGNTYAGTTAVSAGTMLISGNLVGTTGLDVSGGTMLLGAADRINDTANVVLSGGTFSTGATTGFSETVGTVDLNGVALITLALGTGVHNLNFANSSALDWTGSTLTITGWTGTAGASGTAGKIFFGNSTSGLTGVQLSQINFTGYSPGALILSTGEIVAVPEPSTWALLAFGLTTAVVLRRRRA